MRSILILHGINLNQLGKRNPKQYGTLSLEEINRQSMRLGEDLGFKVKIFQSNLEGKICERIHEAYDDGVDAVVINAGAWTHYSYGIRDALEMLKVPVVEVHMSNIHAREDFRCKSVLSDVVTGQISGFGLESYLLGIRAVASLISK